MKKLSFIDKIIFFLNSLIATMLLLSYILPHVAPRNFALLSVLSLAVPLLIILNILFGVYWLLKVKKQILVSVLVLVIGYNYVWSLYKFSSSKDISDDENISIMNYNVRLFNVYDWIEESNVASQIASFIKEENPDVISFQEFHPDEDMELPDYDHKYEKLSGTRMKHGQAIWSKYPIVNSGSIEFKDTANNAIFADIVKAGDTIRIYNVHLQSSGINANVDEFKSEESERLIRRAANTFKLQQDQAELFVHHKEKSPYKMVICGDFNNTAYSYVYKLIKGDLVDAFVNAGNGFGRTYDFKYFPVRIDFILADPEFKINHFRTYDIKLSDHYPILTRISL
ncbi:MAG: endonuclease/exonuclease/phosphatase family protein [Bacteroidia bacterium]|nr:endonuclease/exonuclease/phosphatase family protein [Bacteroidia bacterium]NND51181.1 endonuclease/exonuclease/phosphatase family protein [Flavobacteriaceae bacterium]